jgi:hypothetical protein
MIAGLFLIFFWLGFSRFDFDRDTQAVSKKEFERLLKLR